MRGALENAEAAKKTMALNIGLLTRIHKAEE